jgi:multidrug transporter EmrE-like cation transporter
VAPASFHDFFSASATTAGALIGLLFVAISVTPGKVTGATASAEHQVTAGAAFTALVNTLVFALAALLPGSNLSAATIILAASGLASTVGLSILLYREHKERIRLGQIILIVTPLALYGLQLANGIALAGSPRDAGHISSEGGLSIAFFVYAIARAWQLVGARDSSLLPTVAALAASHLQRPEPVPAGPADESAVRRDEPDGG